MDILTKRGYDFYEITSALQKSIRRGNEIKAGYFALELHASGFWKYLWKRLLVISAEDVGEWITGEIYALFQSFLYLNENEKKIEKGRIFISKAILILCKALKNRDADHLSCFIYDKKVNNEDLSEYLAKLDNVDRLEIPEYALDCHTKIGKMRGMTKDQFFREELEALHPKQQGLFDDIIKKEAR